MQTEALEENKYTTKKISLILIILVGMLTILNPVYQN